MNVLVALAWPNHVHHRRAHAWLAERTGWATCPLTQSGFVRVSSNRKALPDARTPAEARALLAEMAVLRGHRFWPDAVSIVDETRAAFGPVVSYRQVTDAHLLEVALDNGGYLATFDRGILDLVPPDRSESVRLIP